MGKESDFIHVVSFFIATQFGVNHVFELGQDFVFAFLPFLLAEHGQGAFFIGRIDLIFLSDTDGFHATMSEEKRKI
jgi:hypothetical protein